MTGIQGRNRLTALLEEHIAKFRLMLHSEVNQYNKPKKQTIRVITTLPNIKQSSKGKDKTHESINRQNQSTTRKLGKPQWP